MLLAGLWVLSPIDLIPERLPVIGPLDDVVVVGLALRHVARSVPATSSLPPGTATPAPSSASSGGLAREAGGDARDLPGENRAPIGVHG